MKRLPNPVLSEEQVKKLLYVCMICNRPIEGFYGRWGNGGTCSRVCEKTQEGKSRHDQQPNL